MLERYQLEQERRALLPLPEHAVLQAWLGEPYAQEPERHYGVFVAQTSALGEYCSRVRAGDWRDLPLPAPILGLDEGPTELARLDGGVYLCDLSWEREGDDWLPYTGGEPAAGVQRYRLVAIDFDARRIHVILMSP